MKKKSKLDRGRRNFLKSAGATAGSATLLSSLNNTAFAQSSEPVVVGAPLPLTGIVAADGIEFRRGLEMAAKEINELGGILGRPIQLAFVDTESKGDDVVIQASQRLIDKDNSLCFFWLTFVIREGSIFPFSEIYFFNSFIFL